MYDKAIIYSSIFIRLKICLTLPVRVSSVERSFPLLLVVFKYGWVSLWVKKDLTELHFLHVHSYTDIKVQYYYTVFFQ